MTYEIKFSGQAEQDLRHVFEYIAYQLQSVQTAAKQLRRIETEIMSLETMPERYRAYDKEPWHSRGLRVLTVNHYLVFYIPNHDTMTVEVLRIMYGGRDIEAQLDQTAVDYQA